MRKLVLLGVATVAAVVFGVASSGASSLANGTISGKVTDAVTKAAVANACVTAVDPAGNFYGANTNSLGKYKLSLAPGPYEVFFADCGGGPNQYVPTVYKNHQGLDSDPTDPVVVSSAATSTASSALKRGGTISVHVQDASGNPLSGVLACPLYPTDNSQDGFCGFTDAAGNLALVGVPVGLNRVTAISFDLGQQLFYNQQPVYWLSDKVPVAEGATTGPLTFAFGGAASAAAPLSRTHYVVRSGRTISVAR